MIPHVVEAKHLGGYKVWIKFDDGASGELDLSDELDGPVFEPLRDVEFFSRFVVRYNTSRPSWEERGRLCARVPALKKLTLSSQSTRKRRKQHAGDATPRS